MSEPVWVNHFVIKVVQDSQIAEYGGTSGTRDNGLLESAIARPINAYSY